MRKRAAALCMTAVLAVTGFAGCSRGSAEDREQVRLMVWSPSEDQSKDSGEWLQNTCEDFADLHPEWDITFVYGVADEATAATQVAQDPEASADVFMYANDTLTVMTDANALAKFGGKYREEIEATNSEEVLSSLIKEDNLYGVPFTTNTWFMYYDKSVFSEEDIKNLDIMLEKGTVAFPFINSWYLPAFYIGNGCTLFGDGTQEDKGVDFGGENAVEVTDYLVDLAANPNFKNRCRRFRTCRSSRRKHFSYFFRFLGCERSKGSFRRKHGCSCSSDVHSKWRGKADDVLRWFQGNRCQSLQ